MNRFQRRKSNGRWRKTTLQDLGVPKEAINIGGSLKCSKCGKDWYPVIKQDPCFDCRIDAEKSK